MGDDVRADSRLSKLTELAPDEPAGWTNWGVLALRQRNYDAATTRFERARSIVPENAEIHYLIGLLESSRGKSSEAISAFRKAIELDPKHLKAIYALAGEIERQGGENSEAEYQALIQKILAVQPDNLAALLELGRVAAKRGDSSVLQTTIAQITARSATWPPEVQEQLKAVQAAAASTDPKVTATRITFLRNVLARVPEYRKNLAAIKPPPGEEAMPFTNFLKLESPSFTPASPDTSLKFINQPVANLTAGKWEWASIFSPGAEGSSTVVVGNGQEVRLGSGATFPFPGGSASFPPFPEGILQIDYNYDFKTDLVLTGPSGVRLMRQDSPNTFTDVTALAKLPPSITQASYTGAWAADIEADGDLDIVLGVEQGNPPVLRNNGDGTFIEIHPFPNVSGLNGFVWADLDADGDPDAALINEGQRLQVFSNERTGQFVERAVSSSLASLRTISAADVNNDGVLDLLAVHADGAIVRLSDLNEGQLWETAEIARVNTATNFLEGGFRLRVADVDNNGGIDLVLAPTTKRSRGNAGVIWLSDEKGAFKLLEAAVGPSRVFDVADLNGDGRLDLIGLSDEGQPIQALNRGEKNYHWQVIRPRARQAAGDQRINSFGIGGEMELRSGLLVQKQQITGPLIHFGLGEQSSADVVRIVWPNGSVRAEFDLKADQEVVAEQRLKGSCPFLFAYNGQKMEFIKDAVPWGSAIGLRINTLGTARVEATEEWFKIGQDQLVPRDGYYDLRITAELWETYYYDHLSLMAVDHPAGTEIFVDERFVIPPPKLAVTTVATPKKIVRAIDDRGQDVTDLVTTLDGKYLDTFGRGTYKGVTRDHFVEIDLGNDVPQNKPLWLIGHAWMHPTDSSINVAISQGQREQPKPLSLEVPDGQGGWRVAHPNLGFPAGRKKICLFDLTNAFLPDTPRRLRLRTNLEVYWDKLEWAEGVPDRTSRITRISPDYADLHYRGYSVISQADESSPEVPDYDRPSGYRQRWRDLIGYYTRFGDVRELLARVDDRYVIMNAGDEMSFRFPAPTPPPAG
ncbi:MAG TPA: FG-GAP-like repeat-containing protein, partial [Pyrinomonadaceae bacterium]|nr:FG-GAP-like repeat-containing protein [Pyrinomonadaceae bacterium]